MPLATGTERRVLDSPVSLKLININNESQVDHSQSTRQLSMLQPWPQPSALVILLHLLSVLSRATGTERRVLHSSESLMLIDIDMNHKWIIANRLGSSPGCSHGRSRLHL
jgi:hypothetical protein